MRTLDLSNKLKIIRELDNRNGQRKKDIAAKYKIAPSTLSSIIQKRDDILALADSDKSGTCRRIKKLKYEDVDAAVWIWLKNEKNNNTPITGSMIKNMAKNIATQNGDDSFLASTGWLSKFKQRYNLSRLTAGEATLNPITNRSFSPSGGNEPTGSLNLSSATPDREELQLLTPTVDDNLTTEESMIDHTVPVEMSSEIGVNQCYLTNKKYNYKLRKPRRIRRRFSSVRRRAKLLFTSPENIEEQSGKGIMSTITEESELINRPSASNQTDSDLFNILLDGEDLFPESPKQQRDELINEEITDPMSPSNNFNETTDDQIGGVQEETIATHPLPINVDEPKSRTIDRLTDSSPDSGSDTESIGKRRCTKCKIHFRKRNAFHAHLRTHIELPIVNLVAITPGNNRYYKEYCERRGRIGSCAKKKITINPNQNNGLKLKFKFSGSENSFKVINKVEEPEKKSSEPRIRILTASEIKQSHSPPLSQRPASNHSQQFSPAQTDNLHSRVSQPLEAMVAMSEMAFNRGQNVGPPNYGSPNTNDPNKIHFECPTLDGLDQFNSEEANKDAAAQLLKQLLETPQFSQTESDWSSPSNEYISIDRLAHICTVCHSNFPDAVMLYEHKRTTGHDIQNAIPQSVPYPGAKNPNSSQYGLHHMGPSVRPYNSGGPPPPYPTMRPFHPQIPQHMNGMPRRTPPPLYRPSNPAGQPANMAPFINMSPDMYNPVPGVNGMNGGNVNFIPTHRISPQQRMPMHQSNVPFNHQQQMQRFGHVNTGIIRHTGMVRSIRPSPPPPGMMTQLGVRSPMAVSPGIARRPMYVRPTATIHPPVGMQQRPHLPTSQHPNNQIRLIHSSALTIEPSNKRAKVDYDDDCEIITPDLVPISVPVIQSVEGGVSRENLSNHSTTPTKSVTERIHLSDQITLSVKNIQTKKPKEVVDILANRGITVTHTPQKSAESGLNRKVVEEQEDESNKNSNTISDGSETNSRSTEPHPLEMVEIVSSEKSAEDAVQKLQQNSSVSIISKRKSITPTATCSSPANTQTAPRPSSNPTIDLSTDDDIVEVRGNNRSGGIIQSAATNTLRGAPLVVCAFPGCTMKFPSADILYRHMQRVHQRIPSSLRLHRCKICPAKFSTTEALAFHQRKAHRMVMTGGMKTTADELGIPLVDISNPATRAKLASIGIVNYIPLSGLNKSGPMTYGLPIVSVQGAANTAVCNLGAIGADRILSIGPVKPIPKRPS